jgi:uncharacterized protein
MATIPSLSVFVKVVERGSIQDASILFAQFWDHMKEEDRLYLLQTAAENDNVDMLQVLTDIGADIHAPRGGGDPPAPEGVIDVAAGSGANNAVRWLLSKGAKINYDVKGTTRCFPLSGAVLGGHFNVVKTLVEEGKADINAVWAGNNALSLAMMYGKNEIEHYLRSKGALLPRELNTAESQVGRSDVYKHIASHLGLPRPIVLQGIVPSDPSIRIYAADTSDAVTLITEGMSDRPMSVPAGEEGLRYAEVMIHLPAHWPLSNESLRDERNSWPIEWLRRIALYPHQNNTWLGGDAAIFANGEPPLPLASNTRLTCMLALLERDSFGLLESADGRRVVFYSLYPIYTEERDFEKKRGIGSLISRFKKRGVGTCVDIHRVNVAK